MKTDKKIEEIIKKLIYKSYSFTADWNTDGEATPEEEVWMQTCYKGDAQQAISSKIYKEALEEINSEVQKAREEAVRGFAKWCDDNDIVYLEGFVSHWAKQYLQSLDKGDKDE